MWVEARTAAGESYFFHSETRETRWYKPSAAEEVAADIKALEAILDALTTKKTRVAAASRWYARAARTRGASVVAPDFARRVAERGEKAVLAGKSKNSSPTPSSSTTSFVAHFKGGVAALCVFDACLRWSNDVEERHSAAGLRQALERGKELKALVMRMADLFQNADDDSRRAAAPAASVVRKLIAAWTKKRVLDTADSLHRVIAPLRWLPPSPPRDDPDDDEDLDGAPIVETHPAGEQDQRRRQSHDDDDDGPRTSASSPVQVEDDSRRSFAARDDEEDDDDEARVVKRRRLSGADRDDLLEARRAPIMSPSSSAATDAKRRRDDFDDFNDFDDAESSTRRRRPSRFSDGPLPSREPTTTATARDATRPPQTVPFSAAIAPSASRPRRTCPIVGSVLDVRVVDVKDFGYFVVVDGADHTDGLLPRTATRRLLKYGDVLSVVVHDNKAEAKWSCRPHDADKPRAADAAPSLSSASDAAKKTSENNNNNNNNNAVGVVRAQAANDEHEEKSLEEESEKKVVSPSADEMQTPSDDKVPTRQEPPAQAQASSEESAAPTTVHATVERTSHYGYFLRTDDGRFGLLHVSNVRPKRATLRVGDRVEVVVARVNPEDGRCGFEMRPLKGASSSPKTTDAATTTTTIKAAAAKSKAGTASSHAKARHGAPRKASTSVATKKQALVVDLTAHNQGGGQHTPTLRTYQPLQNHTSAKHAAAKPSAAGNNNTRAKSNAPFDVKPYEQIMAEKKQKLQSTSSSSSPRAGHQHGTTTTTNGSGGQQQ